MKHVVKLGCVAAMAAMISGPALAQDSTATGANDGITTAGHAGSNGMTSNNAGTSSQTSATHTPRNHKHYKNKTGTGNSDGSDDAMSPSTSSSK